MEALSPAALARRGQSAGPSPSAPLVADAEPRPLVRKSGVGGIVTGLFFLIVMLALVSVGVIGSQRGWFRPSEKNDDGGPTEIIVGNDDWHGPKQAVIRSGVRVSMPVVTFDQLRGRDANNQLVVSPSPVLIFNVEVRAVGEHPVEYRSWHAEGTPPPTLTDNAGNEYLLADFGPIQQVKNYEEQRTLAPGEKLTTIVAFALPDGLQRSAVKQLRLQLPGEAVGASGSYRWEIPVDRIQGFTGA